MELKLPSDEIYFIVKDTITDWLSENNKTKLVEETTHLLNKAKAELVFNLLGFKKDYWSHGKWEIDHCNGRSGNSPIGNEVHKLLKPCTDKWMNSLVLPEIPKKLNKQIEKELLCHIEKDFYNQVKVLIKDRVNQQANEYVNSLFENNSKLLRTYIETDKLLHRGN